jgi:ribosome biogenesis protein ENP2
MHGYFVSLKLYDAARVIANPFEYAEHREKLVREKLEKAAESRIRAPKNAPAVKFNKALAERVRRDEERALKKEERRKERKAKAIAAKGEDAEADVDADADAAVDAEEAEPMDIDEREKAAEKPSVLNDSRFAALFENQDFEVDENTREYALTHPSEFAHNQDRAADPNRRQRKTAVEEEEDESDRASSDGLGGSSEDSRDDANSDDSSDAGGKLHSYFRGQSVTDPHDRPQT